MVACHRIVFPATSLLVSFVSTAAFAVPVADTRTLLYENRNTFLETNDMGSFVLGDLSTKNDYSVPLISVQAHADAASDAENATQYFRYFFEITGPESQVVVHIDAMGGVSDIPQHLGSLNSGVNIDGEFGNVLRALTCNYNCSAVGGTLGSFSLSGDYTLNTGKIYSVYMFVSLTGLFTSASGFVDPYFDIPVGYQIEFSPGVGNSRLSPVPLPPTLPLFALAAGFAGLVGWRTKKG